mmetsp:Transcript_25501/g.30949  ORF Transcript_25501/g.30949 Transcript_25501/m.30949 type:complete len:419 (+) Transcript_25501:213-1469(+)
MLSSSVPTRNLQILFLICANLFPTSNPGSPDLSPLLLLLTRQLLLRLLHLDGVTHGINHLLHSLELGFLVHGVLHPLRVTLAVKSAVLQHPCLRAELRAELIIVGDHDNTSLEDPDGSSQCAQRVAVQVVGRLVKDDNMRLVPHSSGQHNLHLLTSRKSGHTVVGGVFSLKTNIGKMLLNVSGGQGPLVHALTSGDLLIHEVAVLGETSPLKSLLGDEDLVVEGTTLEGNLVFVLLHLLVLPPLASQLLHNFLQLDDVTLRVGTVHKDRLPALLLLFLSEGEVGLHQGLLVVTVLVTPLDVLVGGLVKMVLNVCEGVLGNVSNTDVRVLPDNTVLGLELTNQELDHGGLTSTVDTNACNARGQRDLDSDARDGGLGVARVGEGAARHLHEGLTLGLDTFKETRLGQDESLLLRLELEV